MAYLTTTHLAGRGIAVVASAYRALASPHSWLAHEHNVSPLMTGSGQVSLLGGLELVCEQVCDPVDLS